LGGEERSLNSADKCQRNTGRYALEAAMVFDSRNGFQLDENEIPVSALALTEN
jgi:hypothetical protein